MATTTLFSMQNPVFASLLFYGALVLLKLIFISFLVTIRRLTLHVYSNPEDCAAYGPKDSDKVKPNFNNELVERARRNHANDIENIPLFLLAALLYVAVNPAPATAILHFQIFTAARYLHTIAYQFLQIAFIRSAAHVVGMLTCGSMLVQIVMATL